MSTTGGGETILVTGATGTVGSEVVRQLAASGVRVRAAARSLPRLTMVAPGVEFVAIDFRHSGTLARALAGVDRLFLLTPLEECMVEVGRAAVEGARAAGVKHIVRLSAFGAGENEETELARVHRIVEELVEVSGIAFTHLRPNSFMQNLLSNFGELIRNEHAIYMPQGEGRVSMIDVRDIAAVAVAALSGEEHAGRAYELTGPEALSAAQVAEVLSDTIGQHIRYFDVPESAMRTALSEKDMSPWIVDVIMELYAVSRAGLAARVTDAVQEVLGRPPTSFRQFVRDHAGAFGRPN